MWIWWIISLIVLIACFIFAYKMIASSYESMPSGKKNFLRFNKSTTTTSEGRTEIIYELKSHLKKMEENASLYEIQFSKLQQRLNVLEGGKEKRQVVETVAQAEQTEDWKEMYYEENEAKEKLENELDMTLQKLEEVEMAIASSRENQSNITNLQSNYDARLNDLKSKQEHIDLLQRKIEGAREREKELQHSLQHEINSKKQLSNIGSENARLKSENDELRSQLVELDKKEKELRLRIGRVSELESKLFIYEQEKAKMIANLENMVKQNKLFSSTKNPT